MRLSPSLFAAALLLSLFAVTLRAQDEIIEGHARPEVVSIGRMVKRPVLDGDLADWPADATGIMLGEEKNGLRRHFTWTGTRDASAVVRLAWDDDALYLAADVCDDKLVQVSGTAEIYQGDSLEMFFNVHPGQYRTDGFWQLAIAPPLKEGESLRVVGAQKEFEGVEGGAKVYPGGYTLECRIPWKNLTGFAPAVDHDLGFQVMLDDRDAKGRKSQQMWYPSGITYSQPTHMNTLRLAYRGDTALPRVVAGPNTWCIADAKKMAVSVLADVPGAKNAVISLRTASPLSKKEGAQGVTSATPAVSVPSLTLPLEAVGPRVSIADGALQEIDGLDGLCDFHVAVLDAQGVVRATGGFQAELSAKPFARVKELAGQLPKRIDALAQNPAVDPMVRQGLAFWMARCNAFIANEARPESASRRLLDQLVEEMNALDAAVTKCEAGGNPYDGMTGCFIKAYTSPLTGKARPLGLLVPKDYDAKEGKRWPLIFLLHGIFADERQLSLMAGRLRDLGAIVCQAPSYRPLDWGGVSAAESWAGLDEVMKQYKIDADRVYLVGHAIGGRGVWQMGEGRPDLWAACAALLSGADTGPKWEATRLYPQYLEQANDFHVTYPLYHKVDAPKPFASPLEKKLLEQASLASRVENLAAMPLRSSYGEESPDTAAERLAMMDRFIALGAPLATHEVPGAGHGAVAEEWQSPEFYQWLLAQRRPPVPAHVKFTANGLRYNSAWWVRVDQLSGPAELGTIDAAMDGGNIMVKTGGVGAFTLSPKAREEGGWTIAIDGQPAINAMNIKGATISFVRNAEGTWEAGSPKPTGKRHGLSGPIDDFQFGRFMVVYGTQGDEKANALLAKMGKKFSDWNGAMFESKADRDVTPEEMQQCHLVLIGTPGNNSVLAKMKDALPLKWTDDGFSIGGAEEKGAGTGACFIHPNPLAEERYVVVVTANDEEGYGVWAARERGPSDDYLLGHGEMVEGKEVFTAMAHGVLDNQWNWTKEGEAK